MKKRAVTALTVFLCLNALVSSGVVNKLTVHFGQDFEATKIP